MIVAPWHGEFGWEVALWVPWLRWMRLNVHRTDTDFIVTCAPGHEFLYADFATKQIPIEMPNISRRDCQNVWIKDHGLVRKSDYVNALRGAGFKHRKELILTPHDLQFIWPRDECPRPTKRSTPRAYFDGAEKLTDHVAMHVRNYEQHPERNWSHKDSSYVANALMTTGGFTVHCIGTGDGANTVDGATDSRGLELRELCALLANCKLIIGPSSGPLHLANFNLTPALWWSGNEKDIVRYGTHWNPFNLRNAQVGDGWQPKPEAVLDSVAAWLFKEMPR